jgi:uncharacterized membrane protein (DUF106 family)
MKNIIYDNYENMIGYNEDIIENVKEEIIRQLGEKNYENIKELAELLEDLMNYDYDLVKVSYHPMGAYKITKLIEEK